jgi:hypothetical protein
MLESLSEFAAQSAETLSAADSQRPTAVSPRSGRVYQPGIGPHPEDRAVDLVVAELKFLRRVSWSIVGRWTAGAGDAPSPSETDEVTNVGA